MNYQEMILAIIDIKEKLEKSPINNFRTLNTLGEYLLDAIIKELISIELNFIVYLTEMKILSYLYIKIFNCFDLSLNKAS